VATVVDLTEPVGTGPLWGTATDDLNATLLAWPPGGGAAEHVNAERDVLVVVLAGAAVVTVDGEPHTVEAGGAIVLEKGRRRGIVAGAGGVRYLSVHRRRPPLQIGGGARSS
jgi:quercetin dioxygenase-like cupin family protein